MTEPLFPGWDLDQQEAEHIDRAYWPPLPAETLDQAATYNRIGEDIRDKIRRLRAEADRLVEQRDRRIRALAEDLEVYEAEIERWHRTALTAGDVGKTVEFPSGPPSKLKAQGKPKIEVDDEEAFRAWAAAAGVEADFFPQPDPPAPKLSREAIGDKLTRPSLDDAEPGTRIRFVDKETGVAIPGIYVEKHEPSWLDSARKI